MVEEPDDESVPTMLSILCISCGYELQGLPSHGPCPECGVPIASSLAGRYLAGADPQWLRMIVRGQRLLALGVSLATWTILGMILTGIAVMFLFALARSELAGWVFAIVLSLLTAAIVVGTLLSFIGCVLVTRPDPREQLTEGAWSYRAQARLGTAGTLVVPMAGAGLAAAIPQWLIIIQLAAVTLFGASAWIAIRGLLVWLDGLARRVPRHDLFAPAMKLRRTLSWLIPLMVIGHAAEPAMRLFGTSGRTLGTTSSCAGCLVLVLFLSAIATLSRTAALMREYHRAFSGCLSQRVETR